MRAGRSPRRSRSLAAVTALSALVGACVPADAFSPRVPSTLDGALAEAALPALDYAAAAFSGAGMVALPIVPSRCSFEPATSSFVCAPLSGGGLTLNQRFVLVDSAGNRQSAFDETTTTRLSVTNLVTGTVVRGPVTLTVDGKQTLDLTKLGSARHTLNGTSVTATTLVDPALGGAPVRSTIQTTLVDLLIPVLPADRPPPWPLSGMIDIRSFANGDVAGSLYVAEITFNGSSLVTLTHTVPGGIQTCHVDIVLWGLNCEGDTTGRPLGP